MLHADGRGEVLWCSAGSAQHVGAMLEGIGKLRAADAGLASACWELDEGVSCSKLCPHSVTALYTRVLSEHRSDPKLWCCVEAARVVEIWAWPVSG